MNNWSKYNDVEWILIQDKLNNEWKKQDAYKEKNKKAKIIQFKKMDKQLQEHKLPAGVAVVSMF